jgi:hypothetical protein
MKRQEGTMQLRHIRPGSVDWQDANGEDMDKHYGRLNPEEIIRLRDLSEERRVRRRDEEKAQPEVH